MTLRMWAIAVLLAVAPFPAQAQLFGGGNALLSAVQEGGPSDVRDVILTGQSVHVRTPDGTPAIVLAARRRNAEIVAALLDAGARANDAARNGETALLTAAANGDDDIVALLLAAKADPDKPGELRETPLLRAVRGRHAVVVKRLLAANADPSQTDSSGTTALSLAESLGDTQIAGLLRKGGVQ